MTLIIMDFSRRLFQAIKPGFAFAVYKVSEMARMIKYQSHASVKFSFDIVYFTDLCHWNGNHQLFTYLANEYKNTSSEEYFYPSGSSYLLPVVSSPESAFLRL